jgi:S-DNA-T family DNA segregation ATPase FtsK/SpoIIIE
MARLSGIQRLLETGIMITGGLAFFLLLALASFEPSDPSWSQTGNTEQIGNWMGSIGAWLADVLFSFAGYIAFILPVLSAIFGWWCFRRVNNFFQLDFVAIALRLIGILLLMLGAAGLASINFDDLYYFSAGGLIGDIVAAFFLPYLNLAGTILLLLCFFCAGITLVTGISWLTIVDGLGATCIRLVSFILTAPTKLKDFSFPRLYYKPQNDTKQAYQKKNHFEEPELTPSDSSELEPHFGSAFSEPEIEVNDVEEELPTISDESPSFSVTEEFEQPIDQPPPWLLSENESHHTAESANPSPEPKQKSVVAKKPASPPSPPVSTESVPPLPSFELLDRPDRKNNPISQEELDGISRLLEARLSEYKVEARVVGVYPGPVITRFELDLAPGVKVSKITGLSKDLAREMSAASVRVVEVIQGKSVIGLELPNKTREMVRLSEVITCDAFKSSSSNLAMVLGADISGAPVVVDLAKMPHLLVAGTTGSGKSVGVNVMILSLLYKSSPEDVRMIMIDPKMLELSVYSGIPHLLADVVTDMKEAANALRWCVGEMERRYQLMARLGVRNIKGYNAKIQEAINEGTPIKDPLWRAEESMDTEAPDLETLPSIVVVVDEFADMMMIVGKKVEELIARIAQKARAAGIHLILATQRPSVDVITGLIKANIPTRIAFQVSSKIDSRTILDQQGAESLLGMGDMLYLPPGTGVPTRVHGAFVDDHEVHAVVSDWKRRGAPQYIDEILDGEATSEVLLPGEVSEGQDQELDALYDQVVAAVTETRRVSISSVQRQFKIGYNRAARIVEQMEMSGVVTAAGHNGNREVLAPPPPKD